MSLITLRQSKSDDTTGIEAQALHDPQRSAAACSLTLLRPLQLAITGL
ncbi:hypothetical protein NOR53_2684 [gamma proteobacterium NOR5-3]|nr:hypothetical protein NOR53_2684 [gamma proteobacterium NOR5-3]